MTIESEQELPVSQSFLVFLKSLLKRWPLFCIVGLAFGIAGFIYAWTRVPKYESNLTFVLNQGKNSGISGALSLAAQFGLNINNQGNDVFSGDNILEIIRSRRIVENVFLTVDTFNSTPYTLIEFYRQKTLNLDKKEIASSPVHFPVGVTRASLNYAQDSVLYTTFDDFTKFSLKADRPDKMLSIFSIRVKTTNEKFTKVFTDRLIHAADSFYTEICSKKERETLDILEQRVASMRGGLSSSLSSKAASQDANLNPAFAQSQVPLQKQQINAQVYGNAYSELFKNLELARFQYLNKIPLIQIIDQANYPMKKIKASKLKTSFMFAFAGLFITFLIFWLIRLYNDIR
ncbi:MAG: Wzz/FepE/Etk N-terminal domain-containing protein [Ginsengibacter sp.]